MPFTSKKLVQQSRSTSQRGFTLIEIIVVVAIIGIMVALLGVRMSRDSNRLAKLDAKRFHMVVSEVRDEAILAGENFILNVDEAGSYSFTSVNNRAVVSDDGLLKRRTTEKGVKLSWDVFEDISQDEDDEDEEQGAESMVGKVLITPLGEITPFEIKFSGDEQAFIVFVDEQNRLARREGRASVF